ncbi:MAG: hypothetical protein HC830_02960 [Bacteroidetes bacterium]|nr:hypothetical protein [Bacteroidota bacterium]
MKKLLFIVVLFSGALQGFSQSPAANRKVVISLQPNEVIMYAESHLSLLINNNQVSLTTKMGDKYYVYNNGVRKGPFDDIEELEETHMEIHDDENNKCSVYQPMENSEANLSYLSANDTEPIPSSLIIKHTDLTN